MKWQITKTIITVVLIVIVALIVAVRGMLELAGSIGIMMQGIRALFTDVDSYDWLTAMIFFVAVAVFLVIYIKCANKARSESGEKNEPVQDDKKPEN